VERAENVLAFGLPGRGKTHLLCAIGHELVNQGRSVLFIPTFNLVQRLLVAKLDLKLDAELRRLYGFDAIR
jgi:DNA replication protein DnaC